MRSKVFLLLCLLLLTACSAEPVADESVKSDASSDSTFVAATQTPDSDSTETPKKEPVEVQEEPQPHVQTAEEIEAERIAAAEAKAEQIEQEASEKIDELLEQNSQARQEWQATVRAAKTPAEREEAMKNNPAAAFSQKFYDLYTAYPKTIAAKLALNKAVEGSGEGKTLAMTELLEMAEMDVNSEESKATFFLLAKVGSGEQQLTAMQRLLEFAEKSLDSNEDCKMLLQLIGIRGDFEPKTKAIERLLEVAEADVRSNKSADYLILIASEGKGETKVAAMNRLIEHHLESDKMIKALTPMARAMPSAENEKMLKEVCRKATAGDVKGNAIVTLSKFINFRNMYRDYYGDASQEILDSLGKETIAYLRSEIDPNEAIELETMLDSYVTDHEALLEAAKKELFVVRNLSVGKTAPEIVGTDLDGKEFKLSDYRGKVVFLDFWGDW